jgi:hypothetical protein
MNPGFIGAPVAGQMSFFKSGAGTWITSRASAGSNGFGPFAIRSPLPALDTGAFGDGFPPAASSKNTRCVSSSGANRSDLRPQSSLWSFCTFSSKIFTSISSASLSRCSRSIRSSWFGVSGTGLLVELLTECQTAGQRFHGKLIARYPLC